MRPIYTYISSVRELLVCMSVCVCVVYSLVRLAVGSFARCVSDSSLRLTDRMYSLCKRNTHMSYALNALHTSYSLNGLCYVFLLLLLFSFDSVSPYFRLSVDGRLIKLTNIFFCMKYEWVSEWVSVVFSLIYYFSLDVFFLSHSCVRQRSFSLFSHSIFRFVIVGVRSVRSVPLVYFKRFFFCFFLSLFLFLSSYVFYITVLYFPRWLLLFRCSLFDVLCVCLLPFIYSPVCTCRFALYTHRSYRMCCIHSLGIHCLSVRCNAFW